MNQPDKSVWDIYIDFMQIIFGKEFPPFISAIVLFVFIIAIFFCLIKIIKLLFGGLW
ncbi:hypothetical protein [Spiroplasma endosymbiont of Diplazon laetatorius]|uniref:hypothetical protein n=1 Tax=Spiroplasma endosymbiont of Diplazon laetatorius TaxID=3066322 RepID=UPI0030D4F128